MDLMHKTARGDSVMVDTPLFGPVELPKGREQICSELEKARSRFEIRPSRYAQTKIDFLEYALDNFGRESDV